MIPESEGFSQPDSTQELTPSECLELLNGRDYIKAPNIGANSQLTRIICSRQGLTIRFWLHLASGKVVYIPSLDTLISPAKFSSCFSSAISRVISIPKNITQVWKACDAAWMMIAAKEAEYVATSYKAMLDVILSEPDYVHSNGPLSRREVASIFAEEAKALKYANDGTPHVAVEGADGTYLHLPSLRRVWESRYGESAKTDDLVATLYQIGFKTLSPTPTGDRSKGERASSIGMWRKRKEKSNGNDGIQD